jgi:hypothetical protein
VLGSAAIHHDDEHGPSAVDAELVKRRLGELVGHIHAAQAEMIELLAQLDDCDGWTGIGLRSIGHWASIELGLDARTTAAHVQAARRLRDLPAIGAAARSGELGWAKVDLVARVAEPDSDDDWLDLARKLSVGQLRRTTRAYQRAERDRDDVRPEPDSQPGRKRGIWLFDQPDGLVRVTALLEPDDAAVLKAALNAELERNWRANHTGDRNGDQDAADDGSLTNASDPAAAGVGVRGDADEPTAPDAGPTANGGSAPVGQSAGHNADPDDGKSSHKRPTDASETPAGHEGDIDPGDIEEAGTGGTEINQAAETGSAEGNDTRVDDPARRDEIDPARQTRDRIGARRADALIDLLRASLAAPDRPDLVDDSTEVIVHVDLAFLTGDSPVGRCHTNHGDPLPATPPAAPPATPSSAPCSTTATATPSTSDAAPAPPTGPCAAPWPAATTTAAPSPAVSPPSVSPPTTSSTGPTTAPPTSTTSPSCVGTTTRSTTKAATASSWSTGAHGSSGPTAARSALPDHHHPTTAAGSPPYATNTSKTGSTSPPTPPAPAAAEAPTGPSPSPSTPSSPPRPPRDS